MAGGDKKSTSIAGLDPTFLLIVKKLWALIKLLFKGVFIFFNFLYSLVQKLQGKQTNADDLAKSIIKNSNLSAAKQKEGFLHYGGIKWYSDYTPATLKNMNLKKFPEGTVVKFEFRNNSKIDSFEIAMFGDLYEEQLVIFQNTLDNLIQDLNIKSRPFKELHVLKEMGRFLNPEGVPENEIIGFTVDNEDACLVHEEIMLDSNLCGDFLRNIIQNELNYGSVKVKAAETLWNISESIEERIASDIDYTAPDHNRIYGALRNRHIIDVDSPIAGGVYLGLPAREAITVDKNSDILDQVYKDMLAQVRRIKVALGLECEEKILRIVQEISKQSFPHHTLEALSALRENNRLRHDRDIELDFFLKYETGDREHAALLAAYLLERLNREQENYLSGRVSIDRNWLPGGGHCWVRYTHSPEDIYILDPMKNFCGWLDNYSKERWPYERQSDLNNKRIARPI